MDDPLFRVWRVSPPAGVAHAKTVVVNAAARHLQGAVAVRVQKETLAGAMRVVMRGQAVLLSTLVAEIANALPKEWAIAEVVVEAADRSSMEGGIVGAAISRTEAALATGAGSSGAGRLPVAVTASVATSVSSASRREREAAEELAAMRAALAAERAAREQSDAALAAERAAREQSDAALAAERAALAVERAERAGAREAAILALVESGMARAAAESLVPG